MITHERVNFEFGKRKQSTSNDKADAIKFMNPPKTIKGVQSHLGLFQFFFELIEDYALVAAPLGAVTSPSHP